MNDSELRRHLLQALARASQDAETFDVFNAAESAGERPFRVLRGLEQLRALGLIHPRRVRLTFEGLAVAAACGAVPSQRLPLPVAPPAQRASRAA